MALVLVSMFVGGMVGLERTVLPLLAEREFGLTSRTVILSFIVGFGLAKALTNLLAGVASDRFGRKWVLVTALVYPTLIGAISDVAHPDWRASAVGVYRLWRDTRIRVRRAGGRCPRGSVWCGLGDRHRRGPDVSVGYGGCRRHARDARRADVTPRPEAASATG